MQMQIIRRFLLLGIVTMLAMAAPAAAAAPAAKQKVSAPQAEFSEAVSKLGGMDQQQAKRAIDGVFAALQQELQAGRDVTIKDFGRFYVASSTSKKAAAAGQAVQKRSPRFSPSAELRKVVNIKQ